MPTLEQSIKTFSAAVADLARVHGNRVGVALYASIPTAGIWLVDPSRPQAWARVEPYLFQGQPPAERMNIILERRQDPDYFDQLHKSVIQEWEKYHPQQGA
jgi:hypothetical protein